MRFNIAKYKLSKESILLKENVFQISYLGIKFEFISLTQTHFIYYCKNHIEFK